MYQLLTLHDPLQDSYVHVLDVKIPCVVVSG